MITDFHGSMNLVLRELADCAPTWWTAAVYGSIIPSIT